MVGSVLSNRYELLENIGSGGMAIVYKAKCRLLNRNVAVKILRPEFQEDEEFLKRFTIEAQAAASLSHPNVVSVYDVGKHGMLNYIVMECIEGITMKEYISRKGTISINEAIDFTGQIASALEHAHAKGIIHRDIKPHNIIITNEGVLKVTDFGLARAVSASTNIAGTSSAIGSVHYASPEQARGGFTDERSDIYSLGVVMYEMFTGSLPFDGETPVAVAMKHLQDAPKDPLEINPQIPKAIAQIILKAMEKDTRERFASVTALLSALQIATSGNVIPARSDKFSTKKLPKLTVETDVAEQQKKEPIKKKKRKEDTVAIVAAVATALAIITLLGVILAKIMFPSSKADISVPSLLNMSLNEARNRYSNLQIEEKGSAYSSNIPEGYIMEQDKEEGSNVSEGTLIMVTISRGAQKIELPNYMNQDYQSAEKDLKAKGLVPQISEEHADDIVKGKVIRTNPNAGYSLRTGDTVVLYVSLGKNIVEVAVPSLAGMTEEEARTALKDSELTIGSVTEEVSTQMKGTVINQSVAGGAMISSGTAIDIVLSTGVLETPVPTGTHTLRLELPQEKELVTVRIMEGENTLFEGPFDTSLSPITINLTDEVGSGMVNIYVDDEIYKENVPVTFE